MSNPKINTTTLNQEEQAVSASLFLSFVRDPKNKLGQRIVLPNDKYFNFVLFKISDCCV